MLASRTQKEYAMKKPIFKKWWFWVIIVLVIAIIGSSAGESDVTTPNESTQENAQGNNQETTKEVQNTTAGKEYQKVDIQTMIDELKENALRAQNKYNNLYVDRKSVV